jgi:signal transduction histidine kinase
MDHPKGTWGFCWVGLIDFYIPVVINDFVAAVFCAGQVKWDTPEADKKINNAIKSISHNCDIPQYELDQLINESRIKVKTSVELDKILEELNDVVETIGQVANDHYWANRRIHESDFLSEVFSSFAVLDEENTEIDTLWKVVSIILDRICEFCFFENAIIFMQDEANEELFKCCASTSTEDSHKQLQLSSSDRKNIFSSEFFLPIIKEYSSVNYNLELKILPFLPCKKPNSLLLFPFGIRRTRKGILVLSGRRSVRENEKCTGRVSERRLIFLEKLAHELNIQIQHHLARVALKMALTAKDDFISESGHSLVSPLNRAFTKTHFLLEWLHGRFPMDKSIQLDTMLSIKQDIQNSFSKTRSFMAFCAIGKPSGTCRFDKLIWFDNLVRECTDSFEYLAASNNIKLTVDIGQMPPAKFDEEKLRIVVENLLDNAVKYSEPGRYIVVRSFFKKESSIYRTEVSDFGIGVPKEDYDRIFDEKFYRSNVKDPKRFIPGTGIGLSVAKNIITAHGGHIWVESHQGAANLPNQSSIRGFQTTFFFEIHRKRTPII